MLLIRFYLAYLLVKNADKVPIRVLKCDKCGGIKFKTVETILDDGNAFQAKYRCLNADGIFWIRRNICRGRHMIKFWIEDFEYIYRYSSYKNGKRVYGEYWYTFKARSESSNYLRNKYDLRFQEINVSIDSLDAEYGTVSSKNYDSESETTTVECRELEQEDLDELRTLLMPVMDIDKRNYEEYVCNDDYKKDERWRN